MYSNVHLPFMVLLNAMPYYLCSCFTAYVSRVIFVFFWIGSYQQISRRMLFLLGWRTVSTSVHLLEATKYVPSKPCVFLCFCHTV